MAYGLVLVSYWIFGCDSSQCQCVTRPRRCSQFTPHRSVSVCAFEFSTTLLTMTSIWVHRNTVYANYNVTSFSFAYS